MKNRTLLLSIFLILSTALSVYSQTVRISGVVYDTKNIPLSHVSISDKQKNKGSLSSQEGAYSLELSARDSVVIEYKSLGYETVNVLLPKLHDDVELNILLKELDQNLEAVVVIGDQPNRMVNMTLDIYNTKDRSYLLDSNIESLIMSLPGVSSTNEMSSQYKVRGGNFDENSVYVNGIEIYRPLLVRAAQQEGLSFINPTMVESVAFSAGGYNAEYGDKMSSVLDINYKKPTRFEGSVGASLMDGSVYVGNSTKRFSQISSIRYKTNESLLKTTDTDADYDPKFMDVQSYMTFDLTPRWQLSFLGNYSRDKYKFTPKSRTTSFGTLDNLKNLKINFDGWEKDEFITYQTALTLKGEIGENLKLYFTGSYFSSDEQERYDIGGKYRLTELTDVENPNSENNALLGIGANHEHARNKLDAGVFDFKHNGEFKSDNNLFKWGLEYQHQRFEDKINEWEMRDSTGYLIPNNNDAYVEMYSSLRSNNTTNSNRFSAYLQDRYLFDTHAGVFTITTGLRASYWDFNEEFLVSPRAALSYIPSANDNWTFRLSGGVYYQAPFYKEYQRIVQDENDNNVMSLNKNIKSQRSYHIVLASDYHFKAGESKLKFTSELYYKGLSNIIPYTIDNVKTRYSGMNEGDGYIAGVDFRLFGELVPNTTSWISLSLMKTEQKIDGKKTPLPTDQRYNVSFYFQDYMPGYDRLKMNIKGVFSDGIPFTAPHNTFNDRYFRTSAYKRFDLGLSWQVLGEKYAIRQRSSFCKAFKNAWLGVDLYNIFDIKNVNTHYWVSDVYSNQYAVPNYLTGRQLNVRLLVDF